MKYFGLVLFQYILCYYIKLKLFFVFAFVTKWTETCYAVLSNESCLEYRFCYIDSV
jgi:hypothetical protein